MRHRGIGGITGFGNPNEPLLTNIGKITPEIAELIKDGIQLYFKEYGACDYDIYEDEITIGIEPAYQWEELKIVSINKDKDESYIKNGVAFGDYGSNVCFKTKHYKEYKNRCKFTKFVDRWHERLF
jgi:hypothetical protein